MRITRLFSHVPIAGSGEIDLGSFEANYVARSLRLRAGDPLTLFDGRGGEYQARILEVSRRSMRLAVGEFRDPDRESPLSITLLQGVSKGDRMDTVVQKATELGVRQIVPILSTHSPIRFDPDRSEKRVAHWRRIAISACQQCGRNRVPDIAPVAPLDDWLAGRGACRLVLAPGSPTALAEAEIDDVEIRLLIGPEGGLDEPELRRAETLGYTPCHVGQRILRTETAAIAALAILQARHGDVG